MAFDADCSADEVLTGTDLRGRTAVVTGATSGVGLEIARALAAHGARVVLAARDEAKSVSALATVRADAPDAEVEFAHLDLADLASVRKFALRRLPPVDILVNNAGVMAPPLTRTVDGFESQFGTNHLGHFLLTALLAPRLTAAAPARVVNVTSPAHAMSDVIWDDPNYELRPYDKWEAYAQSKTAVALHAVALDRRLVARGVRGYAANPGMAMTDLWRHTTRDDLKLLMARTPRRRDARPRTPAQAAATVVWAATAPELADRGGVYCEDVAIGAPKAAQGDPAGYAEWAVDPTAAERLWALSEKLVGESLDL